MAKKEREVLAVEKLTPQSVVLNLAGEDVRVAGSASENDFMGKVVACHMRHIFQKGLRKFNDDDVKFSPKELKDLIEAGKVLAEMCGAAYAKGEVLDTMKVVQEAPPTDIDFSALNKIPEVPKANDNPGNKQD
jgi:hypothetical protein